MFYALVIFSVLLSAVAQMLLKKGAMLRHGSFLKEYLNPWVIGGYAILGLSLVLNVFAMSRGIQVKEVGIMESLGYLFVPVLSFLCFRERMSVKKIVSVAVIIAGVVVFFL